jgi:DNA-directed RNA polymerase subunit P
MCYLSSHRVERKDDPLPIRYSIAVRFRKISFYFYCQLGRLGLSDSGILGGVVYECMRCGTHVTVEELSRLPEIKCICGFRVFRKARQPIVKQLKAV